MDSELVQLIEAAAVRHGTITTRLDAIAAEQVRQAGELSKLHTAREEQAKTIGAHQELLSEIAAMRTAALKRLADALVLVAILAAALLAGGPLLALLKGTSP